MIVVYTSIIGNCDSLKQAPPPAPDRRYVCFTNNVELHGRGWEMRWNVPPAESPRKASRLLQVRSHLLFPEADQVIWIDGSCEFYPGGLDRMLEDAGDAELAGMEHPHRHTCWAEGAETILLGQSPEGLVEQQMVAYGAERFPSHGVTTTGLFLRRHTTRVTVFNQQWEHEMAKYGMNDQLSVDYSAWKVGLPVTRLRGHYLANDYARYDVKDHHARRQKGWKP